MLAGRIDLMIDSNSQFARDIFWNQEDGTDKSLFGYQGWLTISRGTVDLKTLTTPYVTIGTPMPNQIAIDCPWDFLQLDPGFYDYALYVRSPTNVELKLLCGALRVL